MPDHPPHILGPKSDDENIREGKKKKNKEE